ncbi:MAG: transporter substrate-binding domain-containing protein [Rhodospirillaceae bacterium]
MRCLTLLPLIGLAGVALSGAAHCESVTLATQDWPPYHMAVNGSVDGISVRVITCVLDRIGFTPDVAIFPWTEAQRRVRDGTSDGFFSAARNAQRDAYAVRSKAIAPQSWRWYWRRDHKVDLQDREAKIAVQLDTAQHQWLIDHGYQHLEPTATTLDMIRLVEGGQVDAALANQLSFDWGMMLTGVKEAAVSSQLLWNGSLGVYFSKSFLERHPGFLNRFDAEIPACRVKARIPEADGSAD